VTKVTTAIVPGERDVEEERARVRPRDAVEGGDERDALEVAAHAR
jgi:hypothetical protein